jgi:hypothetical protein
MTEVLELVRTQASQREKVQFIDAYLPTLQQFLPLLQQILSIQRVSAATSCRAHDKSSIHKTHRLNALRSEVS